RRVERFLPLFEEWERSSRWPGAVKLSDPRRWVSALKIHSAGSGTGVIRCILYFSTVLPTRHRETSVDRAADHRLCQGAVLYFPATSSKRFSPTRGPCARR